MTNFSRFIERNDLPIMVDFWAPWCDPCQMMSAAFKQATNLLEPHIRLTKINIDAEKDIASRLGIQSVPCLVIFHPGQEVALKIRTMPMTDIVKWANNISAP
jgi:thioredoxin 2